jgi:hypothetical protein
VLNPYDPCVANKVINEKQMTVCWHVDNLKVFHMEPAEITKFGEWLSNNYGMTVVTHQGKVHDYLGMILDFSMKGKVMVNMIAYIKKIIADFPEEIIAMQTTPAADHLFTIHDSAKAQPLPEEQAHAFHHASVQLLFLSAQARQDIQPVTVILTTRVKSPDKDNWAKVKQLFGYQKGTIKINMPLILSADDLTLLRWWVNIVYTVHHDCEGHTGNRTSFRQGMALSYLWF